MLTSRLATGLKEIPKVLRRNVGILAPALQKASDPIQQLFVDKIREYRTKNTGSSGKLVDASPETLKELQSELEKATKQGGGGPGVDLSEFPQFKFEDVKVDPIDLQSQ